MANINKFGTQIVYFNDEGRHHLDQVLRIVKNALKKREQLRQCPIVFLTANGEGPAKAYSKLGEFSPRIVAVTFPRTFVVKRGGKWFHPEMPEQFRKFFHAVGVPVVDPYTLPFDPIEGLDAHNQQMRTVRDVFSIFGGGFSLCVQAVMRACDAGHVEVGDLVIAVSGDIAALIRASTTASFLSRESGIAIEEIFCKPRKLTIVRPAQQPVHTIEAEVSDSQ